MKINIKDWSKARVHGGCIHTKQFGKIGHTRGLCFFLNKTYLTIRTMM